MDLRIGIMLFFILAGQTANGQTIPEIDSEGLDALLGKSNDTTYVINFWATWCSPCVKEIGFFNELHLNNNMSNVKVVLISLDFPNQRDKKLIPFIMEKGIEAQVMLVTDLNYNNWIDRVDPDWSGAIPATLLFNKHRRVFLEKELSRDELFMHVKQIMN